MIVISIILALSLCVLALTAALVVLYGIVRRNAKAMAKMQENAQKILKEAQTYASITSWLVDSIPVKSLPAVNKKLDDHGFIINRNEVEDEMRNVLSAIPKDPTPEGGKPRL